MGRPRGSKNKVNSEIENDVEKEELEESEPALNNDPIVIEDPAWAKTSTVDPKTGQHISQWRQEALKKAEEARRKNL